jgi:hypothetical protein
VTRFGGAAKMPMIRQRHKITKVAKIQLENPKITIDA